MKNILIVIGLLFVGSGFVYAQEGTHYDKNKFKNLREFLPTPNMFRTASGAPGPGYYQQKADYKMNIEIKESENKLYGDANVTYHNNAPESLDYLWVQLDQNVRSLDSKSSKIESSSVSDYDGRPDRFVKDFHSKFDGGFRIAALTDRKGRKVPYTINQTMMRIDLPRPLKSGHSFSFNIKWWYNINDYTKDRGRSGYEPFDEGNLYVIAQFYPRMAVYNDVEGWQNLQFYGRSEFALVFGDYDVNITVPSDHIVAATGKLKNRQSLLTRTQYKRYSQAKKNFKNPVLIVQQSEAEVKEKKYIENQDKSNIKTKTWKFSAKNVRDFGFATSRKFIWDAMAVKVGNKTVMAESFYPKEGNPLWEKYSTKVVAHTLKTYSKFTFTYPYHKAISVHARSQGMEYPMICWNYGRPESDGTYSKRVKYGMISVIIHEVGHNFFPMIVNSDERKWGWMDEGLNTFMQYLTEQEWEKGYPSRRGRARDIVPYMKGDQSNLSPIMTDSDNVRQYGPNCYSKPATALNILRETIMGRELFDYAFQQYAQRWQFKHPTPADFFRTMEDASGVDLDWFWRGWFYTTGYCDIAIKNVEEFRLNSHDPNIEKPYEKVMKEAESEDIRIIQDKKDAVIYYVDKDTATLDFYNRFDPFKVYQFEKNTRERMVMSLRKPQYNIAISDRAYFYQVEFEKPGDLVMPIILQFQFEDGSISEEYLPAKIWRMHDDKVTKVFRFEKKVKQIILDPREETADVDMANNYWPSKTLPKRFDVFKKSWFEAPNTNLMQKVQQDKL